MSTAPNPKHLTPARLRRVKDGTWIGVVNVTDGQSRPAGTLRCDYVGEFGSSRQYRGEVTIMRSSGPSLTVYAYGEDSDRWTHANSDQQFFLLFI